MGDAYELMAAMERYPNGALEDGIRKGSILATELLARRKAMAYADSLGIDVDAVARLICPPPCRSCGGSGQTWVGVDVDGHYVKCISCAGRSQHTLHDRLDDVLGILSNGTISAIEDAIERLSAIVADLAKPGVTP